MKRDSHFNGPLAHALREIFANRMTDPWPAEVEEATQAEDAVPLCIDCLHPFEINHSFCPHCHYPVATTSCSIPTSRSSSLAK